MNSLKKKYISNINNLINQKKAQILMLMKIQIIKQDNYDEFIQKLYNFFYKIIKNSLLEIFENINEEEINKRLDKLIKIYLTSLTN